MKSRFNGWAISALIGLVVIIFQLLFPDPVPNAILDLLAKDNSQFFGLNPVLQAFLIIYVIGGWASFFTGVIGWVVTFKNYSE
jgi:hypothetical protein